MLALPEPPLATVPQGHLQILRDFPSRHEPAPRTVRIYTPFAYDLEPQRRYGVLYLQDGQNVFAHPESARIDTWMAQLSLEQEIAAGTIEPWILVAVDHSVERFEDYSPWDDPPSKTQARGERYARFVVDELKPFIDRHYRTRPEPEWTAVAGSSLGGLISLYLGLTRPQVFGRIGGFSPSVMWSQGLLFQHWQKHSRRWSRIYLDAGETETFESFEDRTLEYGVAAKQFYEHLRQLGYGEHEVQLWLEPGGQHFEADWARRFPHAIRWLLGPA